MAEARPPIEQPTIPVSGKWLAQLWSDKPVQVFRQVDDAAAFLAQDTLPYLWDDDPGYVSHVDGKPDPQRELRVAWTVAYLNHPAAEVTLLTLRDHVTPDLLRSWLVAGSLPGLLIHLAADVRTEAAKRIWDCDEMNIRSALKVLSGEYPGAGSRLDDIGGAGGEFVRQRASIVAGLRAQCPPDKREFFESQVSEIFGPSFADSGLAVAH